MTDKDFSQKVLDTIKDKHIKPKPAWEFFLKDSVIVMFFTLSILVGSVAVSVSIFLLKHQDLPIPLPVDPFKDFMLKIPYFWIVILIIFLLIAFYNAKHSKHGYRYNSYLVLLISILVSLFLGVLLYSSRAAEKLEDSFYHKIPVYRQMTGQRGRMFINPQAGMIAGHIVGIENNIVYIQCFDQKIRTVLLPSEISFDVATGMRLMIMGKLLDEERFEASELIPWFKPHSPERKNYQPAY